jgi:hypothetical protein
MYINVSLINNRKIMKKFILITIGFALLTQITHASEVFYMISKKTELDYIISWIFAFSLECSILIFTLIGKRNTAVFFALISWIINLLYYWFDFGFTQQFVAMNVISLIIPITILFYSETIDTDKRKKIFKKK